MGSAMRRRRLEVIVDRAPFTRPPLTRGASLFAAPLAGNTITELACSRDNSDQGTSHLNIRRRGRSIATRQVVGFREITDLDTGGNIPLSFSYGYDVYGNVTSQDSTTFAYNDAQQMRCARCGTANEVIYAYDGAGMRVSATLSGGTTFFVYGNGGNLLWEVAPNGEFKEYIYVAGKQAAVRKVTP